jgi:hypothetical protein
VQSVALREKKDETANDYIACDLKRWGSSAALTLDDHSQALQAGHELTFRLDQPMGLAKKIRLQTSYTPGPKVGMRGNTGLPAAS